MELDISTTPPPLEATLAARRAKRLAILAKYSNQPTPDPSHTGTPRSGTSSAVPPPPSSVSVSDKLSQINRAEPPSPLSPTTPAFDRKSPPSPPPSQPSLTSHSPAKRESVSASPEPNGFTLAKDGDGRTQDTSQTQNEGGEQVSAADYDPNQDRREDEGKRIHDIDNHADDVEMVVEEEYEEDDLEDMFAVTTTEKKKVKKIRRVVVCDLLPRRTHP
jgi:serine/threonine-protein kinase PRP4